MHLRSLSCLVFRSRFRPALSSIHPHPHRTMSKTAPLSVTDLDKQLKLVELQIQLEKAAKERETIALERVQGENGDYNK